MLLWSTKVSLESVCPTHMDQFLPRTSHVTHRCTHTNTPSRYVPMMATEAAEQRGGMRYLGRVVRHLMFVFFVAHSISRASRNSA